MQSLEHTGTRENRNKQHDLPLHPSGQGHSQPDTQIFSKAEACIYVTPECRRYFSARNTHRLSVTERNASVGCSDDLSSEAILGTLDFDPLGLPS